MLSADLKTKCIKYFNMNDSIKIGLFSTFLQRTSRINKEFLRNPVEILVKTVLTLQGIAQYYINLNSREKYDTIKDIFEAVSINQIYYIL